jgi:hypothetical protein
MAKLTSSLVEKLKEGKKEAFEEISQFIKELGRLKETSIGNCAKYFLYFYARQHAASLAKNALLNPNQEEAYKLFKEAGFYFSFLPKQK